MWYVNENGTPRPNDCIILRPKRITQSKVVGTSISSPSTFLFQRNFELSLQTWLYHSYHASHTTNRTFGAASSATGTLFVDLRVEDTISTTQKWKGYVCFYVDREFRSTNTNARSVDVGMLSIETCIFVHFLCIFVHYYCELSLQETD